MEGTDKWLKIYALILASIILAPSLYFAISVFGTIGDSKFWNSPATEISRYCYFIDFFQIIISLLVIGSITSDKKPQWLSTPLSTIIIAVIMSISSLVWMLINLKLFEGPIGANYFTGAIYYYTGAGIAGFVSGVLLVISILVFKVKEQTHN